MKIGFGYDIHPLVPDRPLILGGVKIPSEKGLKGHSDADVVAHAIADALLGAAGLGDIGEHFPDTDQRFKDYNSMLFLEEIEKKIYFEKLQIINIDISIVLETPKISPFKEDIRRQIAKHLHLTPDQVNVKATRGEGLGFVGRGEGAICYAIALLMPR
ncbi:MAG: 2-C-methyl-D-erythritol 2,4-cyclodiphosphate synthase [Calditrichales bacterium]|nr:MAG: 2-C-methyl-D-erythritol 2,4-cyclodiphosphate synthase [Calditrichales bacterium]